MLDNYSLRFALICRLNFQNVQTILQVSRINLQGLIALARLCENNLPDRIEHPHCPI